jgi:hypothetical protein
VKLRLRATAMLMRTDSLKTVPPVDDERECRAEQLVWPATPLS